MHSPNETKPAWTNLHSKWLSTLYWFSTRTSATKTASPETNGHFRRWPAIKVKSLTSKITNKEQLRQTRKIEQTRTMPFSPARPVHSLLECCDFCTSNLRFVRFVLRTGLHRRKQFIFWNERICHFGNFCGWYFCQFQLGVPRFRGSLDYIAMSHRPTVFEVLVLGGFGIFFSVLFDNRVQAALGFAGNQNYQDFPLFQNYTRSATAEVCQKIFPRTSQKPRQKRLHKVQK